MSRVEIEALENERRQIREATIREVLRESLPNTLDPEVPDGADESANASSRQHGEPRDLGFQPRQHFELGEALGMMDFATAAKLAGSRFTLLRGAARATGTRARSVHDRPPDARARLRRDGPCHCSVNDAAVYGTGQLPKFADDLFQHHGWALAHTDRRGAAHQHGARARSCPRSSFRSGSRRSPIVFAAKPARPGGIRAA